MPLRQRLLAALGLNRPPRLPPKPAEPARPPSTPSGPPEPPLEVADPVPGSLLLDIREPAELAGGVASEALLLPMDCVPHHVALLPRDRVITVYCAAGARSLGVAHWLREQGFQAVSLEAGIQSLRWAKAPIRTPDRAGERVPEVGARVGGVLVGQGLIERLDGDWVRVLDTAGLQTVGWLGNRASS